MAGPLVITGGIVIIVQTCSQIVTFIKAAKEVIVDRQCMLAEIRATVSLCQTLQDSVDIYGEIEWRAIFDLLNSSDGPIKQEEARSQEETCSTLQDIPGGCASTEMAIQQVRCF